MTDDLHRTTHLRAAAWIPDSNQPCGWFADRIYSAVTSVTVLATSHERFAIGRWRPVCQAEAPHAPSRYEPGEIVVVSAASGPVGDTTGPLAKIYGARAVGVAVLRGQRAETLPQSRTAR